ncbi:putative ankyrin repeat protein [Candidatus Borrelia fainii]|uniref:Ankyrin repeat protein n=1 Tax=Candidatus Borrelia fainii TaxID=2518322 RepID=A0ABM8DK15_9SPIR|nr:ankyrin repeat domain-containing protein [Candidatus Borrelia fainii]BDU62924.1 putative ankyrin repeat protein [Candidatus Borrelia fainii]
MKIMFILLLTPFITFLNANENIKIIKELSKTIYNLSNKEYEIDKAKLDNFIESIDLNNNNILKELQKIKNDFLITSVYFQNIKGTLIALNLSAEVNFQYKISPLSISIINNDFQTTKTLIDYGIKINQIDETEYPSIFWAIYLNNEKIFNLLKEKGADLSLTLENGKTPIQAAIEIENINLIEILLKKNAYIKDKYKKKIKNLKNKNIKNILKKYKII